MKKGGAFFDEAMLSDSYKQMITLWLTKEWHSSFKIEKNTWEFFRKKVKAMLNESLLTARIREAGFPVLPYADITSGNNFIKKLNIYQKIKYLSKN